MARNQLWMKRAWLTFLSVLVLLSHSGCVSIEVEREEVLLEQQTSKTFNSRKILSGMWEYREGEIMYELLLDRHGNGTYDWQGGRFETTALSEGQWKGIWVQTANDREGGFEARLEADGMAAHGRWWYTRIGNDRAPLEPGGQFILMRKTEVD